MKVILTGATGFIGREVLQQCLAHPSITSLVVLTRRKLPDDVSSPQLQTIVHDNFLSYPDSVLSQLSGADACIWYDQAQRLIYRLLLTHEGPWARPGPRTWPRADASTSTSP